MAAPTSCSRCGGSRWVRYLSETTNGDFEEAFGLCPCNHQLEARGEDRREEPEGASNIARAKLVNRIRAIELRVEMW
jgi:hypothetical protein